MQGDRDRYVKLQEAQDAFDHLAAPKRMVIFENVGHESYLRRDAGAGGDRLQSFSPNERRLAAPDSWPAYRLQAETHFLAENYRAVIDDLSRIPGAWQSDEWATIVLAIARFKVGDHWYLTTSAPPPGIPYWLRVPGPSGRRVVCAIP